MGEPEPTRVSIAMVAPPEIPRNAQQAKVKPRKTRWGEKRVSAAKNSIEAGARKPRPAGYLPIFCAAATKIKRVLLRLLARLGVDHDPT
jgi:hypothetical protein